MAVSYTPHRLHAGERIWPEANCYVDLWIEVLHDRGLDPVPLLAFALAADFEGDQWTFFKPPIADLGALYGVEIEELNPWRALIEHIAVQAARGRTVIVEVDSYCLPDTAGTTYRAEHGKTAVAVKAIDVAGERLDYFHGAGLHTLAGEDFRGAFRIGQAALPPYVELVKWRRPPLAGDARDEAAWTLLQTHAARMPSENPVAALAARFAADVAWLQAEPAAFHAYAFSMLRQLGAASELGAAFLGWLIATAPRPGIDGAGAAAALTELATGAKALQFKLARAVHGKRPTHPTIGTASLDPLAQAWARAAKILRA